MRLKYLRGHNNSSVIAVGLFSFELGGSERVGADVALECARRGFRVICFAFYGSDGPIRQELAAAGIECFDLNYLNRMRFVRRAIYQVALFRFFRRHSVAAVHIHHATSLILGAVPARLAGVRRIVLTEHSLLELRSMARYRSQARRYCKLAHAVSVVHPSMLEFFHQELKVDARRLSFIANGVRLDVSDFRLRHQIRQELGIRDDEFLWMYAGRLARVKDLPTLIRAFSGTQSSSSGSSLRLVLIGDGAERKSLEALCRSENLGRLVSFLGARTNVPRLMTAADGFVMTSTSEGLPMVLLEAMAARVPCIATRVGGIPELFSEGAGLLFEPGDHTALTRLLLQVSEDEHLRDRMADRGFAKVSSANDLYKVVDKYLDLFGLPHARTFP